MHNVWVRLNAVVFYALTVLLVLAVLAWFSTYLHTEKPVIKTLKLNTLTTLRNHGGIDRALFTFDLHADLRPAFHWNLKQLFVYITAEYESKKNALNQVVVWDSIIESEEEAVLNFKHKKIKYLLQDQGAELRNKTVTFKLRWDHMPITGRMYEGSDAGSKYKFPGHYKLKE